MSEQERRTYELVYIIQPNLDEIGITAINERVAEVISAQNGEVVRTETWGKRGLAYPIGNFFDGYFMCHQLAMPPSAIGPVEQALRYSEDVIRFLTMSTTGVLPAIEEAAATEAAPAVEEAAAVEAAPATAEAAATEEAPATEE